MSKKLLAVLIGSTLLVGCGSGSSDSNNDDGKTDDATIPTSILGLSRVNINGLGINTLIRSDGTFVGASYGGQVAEGKLWLDSDGLLNGWVKEYAFRSSDGLKATYTDLKGELSPDNSFVIENTEGDTLTLTRHYPSFAPQFTAKVKPVLDALDQDSTLTITPNYPAVNFKKDLSISVRTLGNHVFFYQCKDDGTGKYEELLSNDQEYMVGQFTLTNCIQAHRNGLYYVHTHADKDDDGVISLNHHLIKADDTFTTINWESYPGIE